MVSTVSATFSKVSSDADFALVAALAKEIWFEHYIKVIEKSQIEYMINHYQSADAIKKQSKEGIEYFLVRTDKPIGYFAYRLDSDSLFISKLYLLNSERGKGFGKVMMERCKAVAKENGKKKMWLTVNKENDLSISVYENYGFKNVADIVIDIGNGFVMDDYKYEYEI